MQKQPVLSLPHYPRMQGNGMNTARNWAFITQRSPVGTMCKRLTGFHSAMLPHIDAVIGTLGVIGCIGAVVFSVIEKVWG